MTLQRHKYEYQKKTDKALYVEFPKLYTILATKKIARRRGMALWFKNITYNE